MGMMKRLIEDMAQEIDASLTAGDTQAIRNFLGDLGGDDTDKLSLLLEGLELIVMFPNACCCDDCSDTPYSQRPNKLD